MSLPEPYYQDSHCTIYLGDSAEVMPLLDPVNLVLTDPPYVLSDSAPGKSHPFGDSLSKFEGSAFTDLTTGFDIDRTFGDVAYLCKPFNVFCFCSNKQVSSVMSWGECMEYYTTLLVWEKPNAVPFANGVWRGDAEFCIHIRAPRATFRGNAEQKRKVTSHPLVRFDGHPTVKPLSLVRKYLDIGSEPGDVVLDPFMGSGTTLVAAKELGRKAIGIEISREYCDIAVKRLRQEVLF